MPSPHSLANTHATSVAGPSTVVPATPSVSSTKPAECTGALSTFDIFDYYYDDDDLEHNVPTTFLGTFEISDDEVDTSPLPRRGPTTFLGVLDISDDEDSGYRSSMELGASSSSNSATVNKFIDLTQD